MTRTDVLLVMAMASVALVILVMVLHADHSAF